MPKRKKQKTNVVAENIAGSKTARGEPSGRRAWFVISAVIIVLVLLTGGIVYYQVSAAPFQQPVVTVDNAVIRMDYFLNRTRMAGSNPGSVLQQLVDEQLVKQMAPTFGIEVTQQQIDDALLTAASSENTTGNLSDNSTGRYLTESEFKTWYSQKLKTSGLSDAEFKDMTRTFLLASRLQEFLSQRILTTVEQIHLNVILLANSADAARAKLRIQQGENFAAVAREVSLDTRSKDLGGDIGWLPRGILAYDTTTFALGVGGISDAVAVNPSSPSISQYLIFMVSEKDFARQIDDSALQVLRSRALLNWLAQEAPLHKITVNYDFSNTANQAWIDWQLSKVRR
ncbi:MAG: hypothetical protein A2Z28_03720 [Chloroflexi bacterium RBG_16_51_9]|nr:MAG: hypothetical protein A2Z28_03720 [Chloroflexi bacterium RBG_16_51_9]